MSVTATALKVKLTVLFPHSMGHSRGNDFLSVSLPSFFRACIPQSMQPRSTEAARNKDPGEMRVSP